MAWVASEKRILVDGCFCLDDRSRRYACMDAVYRFPRARHQFRGCLQGVPHYLIWYHIPKIPKERPKSMSCRRLPLTRLVYGYSTLDHIIQLSARVRSTDSSWAAPTWTSIIVWMSRLTTSLINTDVLLMWCDEAITFAVVCDLSWAGRVGTNNFFL